MATSILVPSNEEIAFKQCLLLLKMNPLVSPTYYSMLFSTFRSLLNIEDTLRLNHMITSVEEYISDEFNRMSLQEAELRMFNNNDLLSGFQVNGILITQLDLQQKLEDIKVWLSEKLFQYLHDIRFTAGIEIL